MFVEVVLRTYTAAVLNTQIERYLWDEQKSMVDWGDDNPGSTFVF